MGIGGIRMSKYIEDQWDGKRIFENEKIYLVNGIVVSGDKLRKETINIYYDDDGNRFDEKEILEFENLKNLEELLKNIIKCSENIEEFQEILDKIKEEVEE